MLAEYSWNGSAETLKRYYVHGTTYIDERAVMRAIGNNSVDYYYYPRELWSVDGLVNNRGHEVEHYTYDAYGLPLIKSVDYRDVNYDGLRDVADRNLILTKVSQAPCTAGPIYDLQGDGDIDSSDAYVAYTLWEQQQSYRALVSLDASGITNPFFFTGQPLDVIDSGSLYLYHYRARAYDPMHGRFMQRDHYVEYNDGMNLYQYTLSNPANYVDWNGQWTGGPVEPPQPPGGGPICCMGPGCCGWNLPASQLTPPSTQPNPPSTQPKPIKSRHIIKTTDCPGNISDIIQTSTDKACDHLDSLIYGLDSLRGDQWGKVEQCLRDKLMLSDLFDKGLTLGNFYAMLYNLQASACYGNTREYVCSTCGPCESENTPDMVTPPNWRGNFTGQNIIICTANLSDPSRNLGPNPLLHEWMRWWVGGNDADSLVFDWEKLVNVPPNYSPIEDCINKVIGK